MGNLYAQRRRIAPFIILAAMAVLALGLAAGPASAQATFTACASCHGMAATHSNPSHAAVYPTCANCHPNGDTSQIPSTAKCGVCHGGVTQILKSTQHVSNGCGTTVGCHGYTATIITTKVTAKVAPTTIRLGKTVKASGLATPATTLTGKKVALRVDFKKGTAWVKVKSTTATVKSTGAYAWTYKPGKKGAYRVTASISATAKYKASKSKAMAFKVN
jgi:hypothetical protein